MFWNSFSAQSVQEVDPAAAKKVPAVQSVHAPPTVLICPAAQAVQPVPATQEPPSYPAAQAENRQLDNHEFFWLTGEKFFFLSI